MFNCYCLKINGRPYAYLKFESQCEGLKKTIEQSLTYEVDFQIVGAYIPHIDF